jgi:hypothetical protein
VAEIHRESGEWLFVDIGFSRDGATCGVLAGSGKPEAVSFATLKKRVLDSIARRGSQLNLLVEAPLSVAFTAKGNPTGRSVERQGSRTRYWYVGLGSTVLLATAYLLRAVVQSGSRRKIRLFEGFVSFQGEASVVVSH